MNCAICKQPIEQGHVHGVYMQVIGFVKNRKGGGINSIRAQEPTGEYAHGFCVDQAASGSLPIPGQMSLV